MLTPIKDAYGHKSYIEIEKVGAVIPGSFNNEKQFHRAKLVLYTGGHLIVDEDFSKVAEAINFHRRGVTILRYEDDASVNEYGKKVEAGEGVFHTWGLDFETGIDGSRTPFSVAIVELNDGSLVNVPTELIRFKNPTLNRRDEKHDNKTKIERVK